MKIISAEEAAKFSKAKRFPIGSKYPIVQTMLALKVGEVMLVSRDEWEPKRRPRDFVYNYRHLGIWKVEYIQDGSGWLIARTK